MALGSAPVVIFFVTVKVPTVICALVVVLNDDDELAQICISSPLLTVLLEVFFVPSAPTRLSVFAEPATLHVTLWLMPDTVKDPR